MRRPTWYIVKVVERLGKVIDPVHKSGEENDAKEKVAGNAGPKSY